jgi:hypothetical protein
MFGRHRIRERWRRDIRGEQQPTIVAKRRFDKHPGLLHGGSARRIAYLVGFRSNDNEVRRRKEELDLIA